jgi:hypothetical protein
MTKDSKLTDFINEAKKHDDVVNHYVKRSVQEMTKYENSKLSKINVMDRRIPE